MSQCRRAVGAASRASLAALPVMAAARSLTRSLGLTASLGLLADAACLAGAGGPELSPPSGSPCGRTRLVSVLAKRITGIR
jgi:hypothetical protein